MGEQLRTFSYGGGVQSTAALVLAAQRVIDFPTFLFANVGEDSENPATLTYVNEVAMPYAAQHGIDLVEVRRERRDQAGVTLASHLLGPTRSIPIPVRGRNGGPVFRRSCTSDFKIKVIAKWQKAHGATPEHPAVTGLGISTDEWHRARTDSGIASQVLEYPLLTLKLSRQQCVAIIEQAGLPIPAKSSCYFCPFKTPANWQQMKNEQPELFARAVEVERAINEKQARLGHGPVWLSRFAKPLDEAIGNQPSLPFDDNSLDNCESGYCMV